MPRITRSYVKSLDPTLPFMIKDDNATASRAYMERARVIGGSAPPSIEGGPVRGGEEAGPDSEPAQGAGDGKGGATAQQ